MSLLAVIMHIQSTENNHGCTRALKINREEPLNCMGIEEPYIIDAGRLAYNGTQGKDPNLPMHHQGNASNCRFNYLTHGLLSMGFGLTLRLMYGSRDLKHAPLTCIAGST